MEFTNKKNQVEAYLDKLILTIYLFGKNFLLEKKRIFFVIFNDGLSIHIPFEYVSNSFFFVNFARISQCGFSFNQRQTIEI